MCNYEDVGAEGRCNAYVVYEFQCSWNDDELLSCSVVDCLFVCLVVVVCGVGVCCVVGMEKKRHEFVFCIRERDES